MTKLREVFEILAQSVTWRNLSRMEAAITEAEAEITRLRQLADYEREVAAAEIEGRKKAEAEVERLTLERDTIKKKLDKITKFYDFKSKSAAKALANLSNANVRAAYLQHERDEALAKVERLDEALEAIQAECDREHVVAPHLSVLREAIHNIARAARKEQDNE